MGCTLNLQDLFPPTASTSQAQIDLQTPTIAFIGHGLPGSSLFHFALNHLAKEEETSARSNAALSEKAKGKQRAVDQESEDVEAEFDDDGQVQGRGRRQETAKRRHVLILTSDLASLRRELVSENDSSLFGRSRDSERTALLQSITFKHLPTSAQLSYFLASFYDLTNSKASDLHSTYVENQNRSKDDPSYLPFEPTMVILHSPSTYLDESVHTESGIEGYAAMLALFVSTFSNFSRNPPAIVLFDPLASSNSLPIIPPHLSKSRKRPRHSSEAVSRNDAEDEEVETLPLRAAIERFFEAVAEVIPVPLSPTSLEYGHQERFRIEARTKRKPSFAFLEFSTRKIGQDDDEDEEEGSTRISVES
ncbi:uncharacterized protein JCM6883_006975 [Sporobolomyces salmoneus]|uniref:uncharacterized protein n=1 Tax=Sporobolomyces salmoneus TaxID=183962 RepID=UPI00317ED0BD